jgi:S1-C subfamily serine protease
MVRNSYERSELEFLIPQSQWDGGNKRMGNIMKRIIFLSLVMVLVFSIQTTGYKTEEKDVEIVFSKANYIPYQEEYEQMLYPTVRISSSSGTGSGVVISLEHRANSVEQIAILTAAHVVGNESTVNVEVYPSKIKIDAEVVITDTDKDLALLRISNIKYLISNIYLAHLAPRNYTPYIFTPVYTVGCSLGLAPRPSEGIISVIDTDHWEVTSPILPGNSGGPVYDKYTYEVIGIAVWVKVYQFQLVTTMAGIVPINQIYEFLQPLINTNAH